EKKPVIFFAFIGEKAYKAVRKMANDLRNKDIYCEIDVTDRSLKSQMKFADKKNALYSVVIGDNEIDSNKAIIKNMLTQETKEVSVDSITRRIIENKI
ncbi:MAG: His/Gly/Thr/Pro-type tRNA ligase C-terminal domain-containing protein, partial [Clostridia bacterium]|nr:His/Gly/Thr/Pro-type tRNA ligase C-terminal domain-containing protein [Clostridia bacterium]